MIQNKKKILEINTELKYNEIQFRFKSSVKK